jgi:hypothetical protein
MSKPNPPAPESRPTSTPATPVRIVPRAHPLAPDATSRGGTDGSRPREIGGPKGLEPTRYGDWEKNGRCIDF